MKQQTTAKIETAQVKQIGRLYEIEKESFMREAFTKQQIARLLTDYNSISLVAKEGDRIIGFIIGHVDFEANILVGHILTLDVSTASRNRGIGAQLLQEIETLFKEKGVQICKLEAREDNSTALRLYEKLGYKKIRKLEKYYGNAHGIRLKKALA
jgi:ribosomal-protein-alanine N-acetyltransferase